MTSLAETYLTKQGKQGWPTLPAMSGSSSARSCLTVPTGCSARDWTAEPTHSANLAASKATLAQMQHDRGYMIIGSYAHIAGVKQAGLYWQ